MLVEIVLDKEGQKCKDWAVTEVVEMGNGKFRKASILILTANALIVD